MLLLPIKKKPTSKPRSLIIFFTPLCKVRFTLEKASHTNVKHVSRLQNGLHAVVNNFSTLQRSLLSCVMLLSGLQSDLQGCVTSFSSLISLLHYVVKLVASLQRGLQYIVILFASLQSDLQNDLYLFTSFRFKKPLVYAGFFLSVSGSNGFGVGIVASGVFCTACEYRENPFGELYTKFLTGI